MVPMQLECSMIQRYFTCALLETPMWSAGTRIFENPILFPPIWPLSPTHETCESGHAAGASRRAPTAKKNPACPPVMPAHRSARVWMLRISSAQRRLARLFRERTTGREKPLSILFTSLRACVVPFPRRGSPISDRCMSAMDNFC